MSLSIIGCVVNGPGEALMTDIGLTGGGAGTHMVYAAGKTDHTIRTEEMVDHIVGLVSAKAEAMAAEKRAEAAEAARQAAE
jgi:(E)-4-hydroxy-3-methylbut-2-enyl-diphosphate synthase